MKQICHKDPNISLKIKRISCFIVLWLGVSHTYKRREKTIRKVHQTQVLGNSSPALLDRCASSQKHAISPRRKSVKDGCHHSQTVLSFKKSLCSILSFCWEKQKVFFSLFLSLFLLPASTQLQALALGHWSLQRTFVSGGEVRNGASSRLACYWSKAPGTQVAKFLYLAFM